MTQRFRWTAAGCLAVMLAGCYATYTGLYFLQRADVAPLVPANEIAEEVHEAILPYGFRQSYRDTYGAVFVHDTSLMDTRATSLRGADAAVHVAIRFGTDPSITISDRDHTAETEFVAALKRSIERRLEECCGVRGLKFERAFDWLS